jgi:hypothetical protein
MAESLRLSGPVIFSFETTPRILRGVASLNLIPAAAGKAKPFRHVLRQSRKTKSCDNGIKNLVQLLPIKPTSSEVDHDVRQALAGRNLATN